MKPAIGDRVTTYLGKPATIVDTDGNGRYKSASGLWWTWDGKALQEAEAPEAALMFELDVSRVYRNKEGYEAGGYKTNTSFKTETHTPESFVETVLREGYPFTMKHAKRSPEETGAAARGVTTPKHTENFISAQILVGDDDHKETGGAAWWLGDDFFSRHGFAFAESASSTPERQKGHAIFLFDRPITDAALYKECLQALCSYYPRLDWLVNVDRTIYSAQGAPVHLLGNICPFAEFEREVLAPHRADEAEKRAALEAKQTQRRAEYERDRANGATVSQDQEERYLAGFLDWLFRHVADTTKGDNRNRKVYWAGREIAGVEASTWAQPYLHLLSDVDARIVEAATANGYLDEHANGNADEVLRVFNRGRLAGGEPIDPPMPRVTAAPSGSASTATPQASANGAGPRFAVGQLVNVVIAGVLQNAAPCLVMDVHEPVNGEHGYTVAWPGEGQPKTYAESCLEAAEEEAPATRGTQAAPNQERLGDYGHARALSHLLAGQYRWVRQWKCWMGYRAGRWQQIDSSVIAKDASERLRTFYGPWVMAAPSPEEFKERAKYAAQTYRYNGIVAALSFLRGWDGFITEAEEWDTDPWLLNVADGTLDLRTFELLPHDPAHLLTKQAPVVYDPTATGPRWAQHVKRFLPDAEIRRQVQRDLGTALVGATLEEALPIWYGLGANGKSTTARVIMSVLGDYGISAARDLLLRKKHEEHPTALADLAGRRLVFSAEADDGQRLNESLVKDLTGGDRKKARFMYGDFFEFEQTFSIVLFVNHKPVITGTDDGIWRRVRLVPWAYQIPKAERRPQEEVVSELLAEAPAILNWLLDGLRDWQAEPHWIAPAVLTATNDYRKEQDRLGGFLGECCELGAHYKVPVSDLYERYTAYCVVEDEEALGKRAFGKSLRDRGLDTKKGTGGAREWHGIRLQKG